MALDNEDIKQLIAILQRGLTPDDSDEIETPPTKTTRSSKPKAAAKPKNKNKFDNMPEFDMFKEDTEFDRKIKKPLPSARLRAFEPITVRCRVCGKNEKVAPNLVESIERYKCNKCSTGAG